MKVKHTIILFILGYLLEMFGGLIRYMHWTNAEIFLIMALALKIFAVTAFLVKLITYPKLRAFLNW